MAHTSRPQPTPQARDSASVEPVGAPNKLPHTLTLALTLTQATAAVRNAATGAFQQDRAATVVEQATDISSVLCC